MAKILIAKHPTSGNRFQRYIVNNLEFVSFTIKNVKNVEMLNEGMQHWLICVQFLSPKKTRKWNENDIGYHIVNLRSLLKKCKTKNS